MRRRRAREGCTPGASSCHGQVTVAEATWRPRHEPLARWASDRKRPRQRDNHHTQGGGPRESAPPLGCLMVGGAGTNVERYDSASSVFVVGGWRTRVGREQGGWAAGCTDHLAADIVKALVARTPNLDVNAIDDVYWGAANQAGEDNRNVARMAVLLAGLPVEIPGATVNRLCGSGMEAVSDAARAIAAGDIDIAVAGGTESMTRAPFVVTRSGDSWARSLETADTRLGWRLVSPRTQEMYPPISLGEPAGKPGDT